MAATTYGQAFAYRPKAVFPLPPPELFASPAFCRAFPEYLGALRELGGWDFAEIEALYGAARETGGRHAELLWNLIALAAGQLVFRRRQSALTSR